MMNEDYIISRDPPKPQDLKNSEKIIEILKKENRFPSQEENKKREEVLAKLDELIKQWIKRVCLKQGLSEELVSEAGSKLVTFGSYRLGVHGPSADIDTLCIVPNMVEKSHFFSDLHEMLKERPEVTELHPVPEAFVPVIKMAFDGVQVDLLFARLSKNVISPDLNILDENNLKDVDEATQRSLNGPRVADEILNLVPNKEHFRTTLRCIKMWATRRAIYGNIVGYLGGVAYAILVAKICQMYPNAAPSTLLNKFFTVYHQWSWGRVPILLKPIEEGSLGFKVWNPKTNMRDRQHLMPIITPAYPSMNSTYNVSKSTLRVMKNEFERGMHITSKADSGEGDWEPLFEETDFFVKYKHYLQIEVNTPNEADHLKWVGFIESKLRFILPKLESIPNCNLHIFPGYFDNHTTGENGTFYSSNFFIGMEYKKSTKSDNPVTVDLTTYVQEFEQMLEWPEKKDTMQPPIFRPIKRNQIPDFVISKEKKRMLLRQQKALKRKSEEEDKAVKPEETTETSTEPAAKKTKTDGPETTPEVKKKEPQQVEVLLGDDDDLLALYESSNKK